jgi:hypothetical protein
MVMVTHQDEFIEVGGPDQHESVYLLETNKEIGPYAALSFCWGTSGKKYLTNKEWLCQHQRQIPWDPIPKTVQDAICCRTYVRGMSHIQLVSLQVPITPVYI